MLRKMLWLTAFLLSAIAVSARDVSVRPDSVPDSPVTASALTGEVTFRFVAGKDMLFVPWGGNEKNLQRLSAFINEHRGGILSGKAPVQVFGYCASAGSPEVRLQRARQMSNRVKSELILHNGLSEEHFRTRNAAEACGELRNAVVVRIVLPNLDDAKGQHPEAKGDLQQPDAEPGNSHVVPDNAKGQLDDSKGQLDNSKGQLGDAEVAVYGAEVAVCEDSAGEPLRGWTVGLNLGIPFFWGDMVSLSADKTFLGIAAGVQAGYRFSSLLGASLSIDYARGRTGARGYAQDYQLSPDGMTLYGNGTETSRPYRDLYSRISVVNVGLGLDVHLNRLFSSRAASSRFQAVITPTVYGQFFHTSLYNKVDDTKFSDGSTKPDALSLGLGGALSLRYRIAPSWSLQLKNSVLWITDNHFDGIALPYDHARQNVLWLPQLGLLWNLK